MSCRRTACVLTRTPFLELTVKNKQTTNYLLKFSPEMICLKPDLFTSIPKSILFSEQPALHRSTVSGSWSSLDINTLIRIKPENQGSVHIHSLIRFFYLRCIYFHGNDFIFNASLCYTESRVYGVWTCNLRTSCAAFYQLNRSYCWGLRTRHHTPHTTHNFSAKLAAWRYSLPVIKKNTLYV